jgi:uncharacterized protein
MITYPIKLVKIHKSNFPSNTLNIKICDGFKDQFLGLMFTRTLGLESGILLSQKRESKIDSAIHMFFMNYDICVLWLDKNMMVVDKAIAKKWHPAYISRYPAQHVLECHLSQYDNFSIGDVLELRND